MNTAFNGRVLVILVAAAILAFVGYLFLSAYAPEMKMGENGRGHALSKSAIGYSALVRLRQELGLQPSLVRTEQGLVTAALLVITPEISTDPAALAKLLRRRGALPTLIILPKHLTEPDPLHQGWVARRNGDSQVVVQELVKELTGITILQKPAATATRFTSQWLPTIAFEPGATVQSMRGNNLESLIADQEGNILLGRTARLAILSDPDLMNNHGIANAQNAWAATRILAWLAGGANGEVQFDVTLNGFGGRNGLLRLAFEPPFLALSLCLLVAALLALWHGLLRFGPPARELRAVMPGKAVLVTNTADLLRQAGREHEIGGRYAALARDLAAQSLGLPLDLSPANVTHRLDQVSRRGPIFSDLAAQADHAADARELLVAAGALFQWRKDKTG